MNVTPLNECYVADIFHLTSVSIRFSTSFFSPLSVLLLPPCSPISILMCSVLYFENESDKLRSLFSEPNHFDSILFIFDGGRRYKLSASSLGISSPQELLVPLGLGLFRSSPFWRYYLYPRCLNFHKGIDGLCGEIIRQSGFSLQEQSCHVFLDRSRHNLRILYLSNGELRLECRRLSHGSYLLEKGERGKGFVPISWNRLNRLLTVKKYRNPVEK